MKNILTAMAAVALVGCSAIPQAGLKPAGAPASVPADSAPPDITAASNDIVGPTWQWSSTHTPGSAVVEVKAPERYTLNFQPGGKLLLRADCNRGSTAYSVNGNSMRFSPIALTRMACPPDSLDDAFLTQLSRVASYAVTGGELLLTQRDGGPTLRLRQAP